MTQYMFVQPGVEEGLVSNPTEFCGNRSGLCAKRGQPVPGVGLLAHGRLEMRRRWRCIALRISRHPCIQNASVKREDLSNTGH